LGKPLVIYDFLGSTRPDQPAADLYRIPGAPIAYEPADTGPLVTEIARSATRRPLASFDAQASATSRSVTAVLDRFGLNGR